MSPAARASATKLKVVAKSEPEPPVDIAALQRAKILSRDWDAMHVRADRRAPIELGDSRRFVRHGETIIVRSYYGG